MAKYISMRVKVNYFHTLHWAQMQGDVTTACSYIGLHNCQISKFVDKYMKIQGQIRGNTGTNTWKYRDKHMEIQGQIHGNPGTNAWKYSDKYKEIDECRCS